jgi:TonB family protein
MSKAFRRLSIVLTLAFVVALLGAPVRADEPAAAATLTTDDFQGPKLLPECKADFQLPSSSRRAVGDAVLKFQAIVLKDGSVGYAELLNNDRPYPGVEQAARQAFRNWRYHPGQLGGLPVDAGVTIFVQFRGAAAASVTRPANQWTGRDLAKSFPGFDRAVFTGKLPQGNRPLADDLTGPFDQPHNGCQFQAGPRCAYMASGGPTTRVDLPSYDGPGGGR